MKLMNIKKNRSAEIFDSQLRWNLKFALRARHLKRVKESIFAPETMKIKVFMIFDQSRIFLHRNMTRYRIPTYCNMGSFIFPIFFLITFFIFLSFSQIQKPKTIIVNKFSTHNERFLCKIFLKCCHNTFVFNFWWSFFFWKYRFVVFALQKCFSTKSFTYKPHQSLKPAVNS